MTKNAQKRRSGAYGKIPKLVNQIEWIPGNTKDAPIERDWGIQGSGGATYAPVPQVVHKGKWLRIKLKKKLKVLDMQLIKIKIP